MGNEETCEETQGQANHESREASATGFAAPDPYTGSEAPPEEILPLTIWGPFEDKPIDECIANIRCEVNCIHTVCSQTQPQNPSEPKVICYDCKEEFPTKNEIMDHKRDSDHHSKKKCNQHECQKSKCWYGHRTLIQTSNDVINQQDIQRFTC